MLRLYSLLLLGLILWHKAPSAAVFQSVSDSGHYLRALPGLYLPQIQHCSQGRCENFPSDSTLQILQGLRPEGLSWENIFSDCVQFEALNKMTNVTEAMASVVMLWNAGGWVRSLPAARRLPIIRQALRNYWARAAHDGVVGVSAIYASTSALDAAQMEEAYPSVKEAQVLYVQKVFAKLISPDEALYPLESETIVGIRQVLNSCTTILSSRIVSQQAHACLSQCHQGNQTLPEASVAEFKEPNYFEMLVPGVGLEKSLSDSEDKEIILEYLRQSPVR